MALVATSGSALNSARSGTSTPRSGKSKTPRTDRSGYERSPQRKMRRSDISDGSKTSRRGDSGHRRPWCKLCRV